MRIQSDGAGVLFVDANEVIHLNDTASWMTKMALDGVPKLSAKALVGRQFKNGRSGEIKAELERIYHLVEQIQKPFRACLTCAMPSLEQNPLFSIPPQAPYKVDMAISYHCNNRCTHCYNEPERKTIPSLPREDWFEVLERLYRVGAPHIIFTGGEPTLHPHLFDLIRYADRLGMITGLNTNGRRLADAAFVEKLAGAGLNHVQITIGSCFPEVHNRMTNAKSYHETVQGIRNAVASSLHTITNTTLMKSNAEHAEEIVDFVCGLGVRTFAMNGMIYSGGGTDFDEAIPEEELAPILAGVRDRAKELGMRFLWYTPTEYCRLSPLELDIGAKRCNAGEYSICIEPNGDVLPCQSYYVSVGNILRDSWESIWESELFHWFRNRREHPEKAGLPEKCLDCPDLPVCGGGCPLARRARMQKSKMENIQSPVSYVSG